MNNEYNTLLNTALDYMAVMNYNKAEELFLDIIKKYPDNINTYYCYGKMKAENQQDIDGAIRIFKQCINDVAPFFEAFKYLAECYLIKRDLYNAEKYLKQALIYNSSSEECISYLHRVFPKLKNYIKEQKTFFNEFYESSKNIASVKYKKIYDGGHITRKAPHCLLELFTEKQKIRYQKCLEQSLETDYQEGFVVEIQDGKVYLNQNCQPYIFPPGNKYLKDILDPIAPKVNVTEMPNSLRCSDNMLVLTNAMGGNYYHWITYTIPRLYMIEQAGYNLKNFDKIAVSFLGFRYQHNILELLNIPMSKIIATVPRGVVLNAKKMVATSAPEYKVTPPVVLKSLREKLLKPEYYDVSFPKKIYLSRNRSAARHILNEDVLTDFLKKEGFEIIYAEDLSFIEQLKYFANADIIISQHGAGLTNLAFSKEGTKVLEIFNDNMKDYMDSGFIRLAFDNNLTHLVMYGESNGLGLDMNIDMDKFKTNYDYLMNL